MTDQHMQVLQRIEAGQSRVEAKLDQLLEALAEDADTPAPEISLDGDAAGAERDQGQSLETGDEAK